MHTLLLFRGKVAGFYKSEHTARDICEALDRLGESGFHFETVPGPVPSNDELVDVTSACWQRTAPSNTNGVARTLRLIASAKATPNPVLDRRAARRHLRLVAGAGGGK